MPTSLLGAVVFVLLLVPGFCYLVGREHEHSPETRQSKYGRASGFRETVALVFASALSLLAAFLLFAFARLVVPDHSPDLGRLLTDGETYFRRDYAYLGWWALVLVAIACALSYAVARLDVASKINWLPSDKTILSQSSWWSIFQLEGTEDRYKRVTCHLLTGGTIEGTLYTFNPTPDEDGDRDLTLSGPLYIQEHAASEIRDEMGAIVISASRIDWMHVVYLTDEDHAVQTTREPVSRPPQRRRGPWIWRSIFGPSSPLYRAK